MEQTTPANGRRRFFRLAGITTAAAGLGTLAFGALAHGRRHGGGAFGAAELEERVERMLKHVYVEIDATPEQQQRIEPIVKQAAQELQPLRAQVREARREGLRLLTADTIDRGALERLRQGQMTSAEAVSRRLTRALADVAEVLTPEQRRTLAARFVQRRGHGLV